MLNQLSVCLSEYMKQKKCACQISLFPTGRALLQWQEPFDVLFLDIRMERPDGMETAKRLRARGFRGLLIFITVLRDTVFEAFTVNACDYLLKPVSEQKFRQTMDRVFQALQQEENILIQKGCDVQVVPSADILYGEVIGRKIYLHCTDNRIIDYYNRLELLEQRLPRRFFRCHRSYLINLSQVRGYSKGTVTLADGSCVPVSRARREALLQALSVHMEQERI